MLLASTFAMAASMGQATQPDVAQSYGSTVEVSFVGWPNITGLTLSLVGRWWPVDFGQVLTASPGHCCAEDLGRGGKCRCVYCCWSAGRSVPGTLNAS